MAKLTQLATAVQNAACDVITALANSGFIRGYTAGSGVPADANTAITDQVTLFTLGLSATAFAAAVAGVATANAISSDTSADAAGTLAFFRVLASNGTTVLWQGTVGTVAGQSNLVLPTLVIAAGQVVSASSMTFTQAASSAT